MKCWDDLWGTLNKPGVVVPLRLKVYKDEQLFLEEIILTGGVYWWKRFNYEGMNKSSAVRLIKILELPPGLYSVDVSTIERVDEFREMESYVVFSYYNPKH